MSKTILNGGYKSAGGTGGTLSNPLHSNAGRLMAILISHAQSTVQTVTFYDSLTESSGDEFLGISVPPESGPFYVRFDRQNAIPFGTGLCVHQGNCHVAVWSVDYG